MNTQLSEHFSLRELTQSATAQRLGILNVPSPTVVAQLKTLCIEILEPLRRAWGAPIVVGSGYRSCVLNRRVGGAMYSDHLFGAAADIHTLSNLPSDNERLFQVILQMMREKKIRNVKQVIDEHNYSWIHISRQKNPTGKRSEILHLAAVKECA